MKLEIEIISRDTIKPSSPTPSNLRNYQLSFLDQMSPPIFMPLIFFYPPNSNVSNSERSNQLKKSLSDTLTSFYPLSGRVVDNSYINCNDEGVAYVEARITCKMFEVITVPNPVELNKLLPCDLDDVRDRGLVIQVNYFDCGGMAIGVGFSHKIGDALSFSLFVNSWSAISRGAGNLPSPKFESAALFPPKDVAGYYKPDTGMVKKDEIVTKRFVFTASKIAALRDKFTENGNAEYRRRPTRIETLSAFIWTRFMAATQAKADDKKIYALLHAVNLRTKFDPPLPQEYFGNISRFAITVPSLEIDKECYNVVNDLREAIGKVDSDYVAKLRQGDNHLNFSKEQAEKVSKGEVVTFAYTSLCRFPLYEADFGWGSPAWVGSTSFYFNHLVTFLDTSSGDGIEAWVNLKKEDMTKLEADKGLLAFASCSLDA